MGQEIYNILRSGQASGMCPSPHMPQLENAISPLAGRWGEPMNTDIRPCIIDDIIKAVLAAGGNMIWHKSPCQGENEIEIQNLKITTAFCSLNPHAIKEFYSCLKTLGGKAGGKHPVLLRGPAAQRKGKEICLLVSLPCNPPNKLKGKALIRQNGKLRELRNLSAVMLPSDARVILI